MECRKSRKINEIKWKSMNSNENQWNRCESVKIDEKLYKTMKNYEKLWKSMEMHVNPWNQWKSVKTNEPFGNIENPWASMKTHAKSMNTHENQWKAKTNHDGDQQSMIIDGSQCKSMSMRINEAKRIHESSRDNRTNQGETVGWHTAASRPHRRKKE